MATKVWSVFGEVMVVVAGYEKGAPGFGQEPAGIVAVLGFDDDGVLAVVDCFCIGGNRFAVLGAMDVVYIHIEGYRLFAEGGAYDPHRGIGQRCYGPAVRNPEDIAVDFADDRIETIASPSLMSSTLSLSSAMKGLRASRFTSFSFSMAILSVTFEPPGFSRRSYRAVKFCFVPV
jgi:hypothetical protein